MPKHRKEIGSKPPNADPISYNTVFVDTSLDTHLLMIIPSSDTVYDFKKKILLQHTESFPMMGAIKIHSLQVKRQGHFYHLPDSILVSSACGGSKKTWFLFVEASCAGADDVKQLSNKPDDASENISLGYLQNHSESNQQNLLAGDPLKLASIKMPQAVHAGPNNFLGDSSRDIGLEVGLRADHQKKLSSNINENLDLPGAMLEKDIRVSEDAVNSEDNNSKGNNKATTGSSLDKLLPPDKKRKIDHLENVGLTSTKKRKVVNRKDSLVGSSEEVPSDMPVRQTDVTGKRNDSLSSDANGMSTSGVHKASQSEPNIQQREYLEREVLGERANSATGEHFSKLDMVLSLQDVKENEQITSVASKKVKKKHKKTSYVPNDQVVTSEPLSIPYASVSHANPNTEALEANKNEEHGEFLFNNDPEVMLSKEGEHLDQGEAHGKEGEHLDQGEAHGTDQVLIPSGIIMGSRSPTEAVDSVGANRKKMRTKKRTRSSQTYSNGEGTNVIDAIKSTVADLALEDHIDDKIQNGESMLPPNAGDDNSTQQGGLSHNRDPQAQPYESFKPSDQVEVQETNKGSIIESHFSGANKVAEAGTSGSVKRKKGKAKKLASIHRGANVTDAIKSTVAGLASEDNIIDKIQNDESMFPLDVDDENNGVQQDRGLLPNHDPHARTFVSFKHSDQVEAQATDNGLIIKPNLSSANEVAEVCNSGTVKRKKGKAKRSAVKLEGTAVTGANKSAVTDLALEDHFSDKILKDQGMLPFDVGDENNRVLQDRGLSPNHNPHEQPFESFKLPVQAEAQETDKGLIVEPNLSGANEVAEAGNSGTVKRKKGKVKKSAAKLQGADITDAIKSTVADVAPEGHANDKILNDEGRFGHENSRVQEDRGLPPNHNPQEQPSESYKLPVQAEAQETDRGLIVEPNPSGANEVAEAGNSGIVKRKKGKAKKSAGKLQGANVTDSKSSVADLAPEDHVNDKMQNDEGMFRLDASDENNKAQQGTGFSPNYDPQAQPSRSFKPSDKIEAQETEKGSVIELNSSGANEVTEAGKSGTIKGKKRPAKKSVAGLQDRSDVDNLCETSLPLQGVILDVVMNDETIEENKTVPYTVAEQKNDRELSSGHRPEEVLPKGNKALDSGDVTVNNKESGFSEMSLDAKHGSEAGKSGHSRKKKRVKKPPPTSEDISSLEHLNPVNHSHPKHFEGDRELSFKCEADVVPSQASKTLDLAEVTVKGNQSGFTVEPVDNEDGVGNGKSGSTQKKNRAKKHSNSVCDSPAKHFPSEAQGNQNISSGNEDKQPSNEELRNVSTSGASKGNEGGKNKEVVQLLAENDQTWEDTKYHNDNEMEMKKDQTTDTTALQDLPDKVNVQGVQPPRQDEADKEESARNAKRKVKKKTKRNQNAAVETQSNSTTKGENISIAELAPSGDKLRDRDHQYDTMNTSVSAKTRAGKRLAVSEFLLEKDAGVNSKSSNSEQALKGAKSSEIPSHHTRENNLESRPEIPFNIDNIIAASEPGDEGINFRHYFVPGDHQSEKTSADKVKGASHSSESKRKVKKPNVVSEWSLRSAKQTRNKSNTTDNQLEESPDAKQSEDVPLTKETLMASGNVEKTLKSRNVDKFKTPSKVTKPLAANGSGSSRTIPSWPENNGSVTASSSSSDKSSTKQKYNSGVSAGKTSGRNTGHISKSSQGKSLLSTGAIFSDASSGSSGDENGIGNSDASTRTPSDKSSSSGYSDDDSELSQDSRRNGSEDAKRKDGGINTLNPKFSDPKDMSLHMILRSSKRFKKAKITASQSQEADLESEPVEFVPESQAS